MFKIRSMMKAVSELAFLKAMDKILTKKKLSLNTVTVDLASQKVVKNLL